MKLNEAIPLDDIFDYYSKSNSDKRVAVSSILRSDMFCVSGGTVKDTKIEAGFSMINSTLEMSIGLVIGMVKLGKAEYGNLWVRVLKEKIDELL